MSAEKLCPHCGARIAWNGSVWLIADKHGHVSLSGTQFGPTEPEPELRKCLQCRRPLMLGSTRVEEVEE